MKSNQPKTSAEQVVKDIRRATRRHYSTEYKIQIVLSGLRGGKSALLSCAASKVFPALPAFRTNPDRPDS